MNTATFKQILGPALALCAVVLSGCGPVYVEDRWYARDYYANNPGAPRPVVAQTVVAGVAPDPQFTDLSPYGQWDNTGEYGRVWIPYANRTPGWRPYYYGSWSHTEWGWSWVSDEVWGAGPYHYGRWTWMNGRGWAWIPDYTWGPSWVVWSSGGGCVGWAPMGPGGARYTDIHAHHTYWTYVPTKHFGGGKVQHVVVAANDVPRVHSQTVVLNESASVRGTGGAVVAYNPGPQRAQVQEWTARPVETRQIGEVPSAQPRRIPENVQAPSGGSRGTAIAPAPGRTPGAVSTPETGTYTQPTRPGVGTQTPDPSRPGIQTRPGVPDASVPETRYPDTRNPGVQTRPGVATPTPGTTPYTPPTRPGVGTPGDPPVDAPTRPGVGTQPGTGRNPGTDYNPGNGRNPGFENTPVTDAPTRPGVGSSTDAPSRPGVGYTGPGPINVAPLPTVPRPTPPPVERGNYAPAPTRYAPPTTAPQQQTYNPQPSRPATPQYVPQQTYNPQPAYNPQPSRPATPSYNPAPSYSPPSRPAYQPAPQQQQRFSPPPSFAPSPQRAAPSAAPAPRRR